MMKLVTSIKSKVVAAGLLTAALAFGGATAAHAEVTTGDCWPAVSSGQCYGGSSWYNASGGGAQGHGIIGWYQNSGVIEVDGKLKDLASDGAGPVTAVRWKNGSTGAYTTKYLHWTGGTGTTSGTLSVNFYTGGRALTSSDEITIKQCNGYDGNGNPQNCESSWHGPFHK